MKGKGKMIISRATEGIRVRTPITTTYRALTRCQPCCKYFTGINRAVLEGKVEASKTERPIDPATLIQRHSH